MSTRARLAHLRRIAQKGGLARAARHGNPGTTDGRRKGGIASIQAHIRAKDAFRTIRVIKKPPMSILLAETLGIMIGDGHLSPYQATIATSIKTDYQHAVFAKNLFERLFGISGKLQERPAQGVVVLVLSSKNMVEYISRMGMPIGNKIHQEVGVPAWIFRRIAWQKAFIRGLFDTDGCVFSDNHTIKGVQYRYPCLNITSYSPRLITGVLLALRNCGFAPTNSRGNHGVFLRRRNDVIRYFRIIGTSNKKHSQRYADFTGRVPKRS